MNLEPITVEQSDNSVIGLVPGQLYHDFSGPEEKAWYVVDSAKDECAEKQTSNKWGTILLYLGSRPSQQLWPAGPQDLVGYFLSDNKVVCIDIQRYRMEFAIRSGAYVYKVHRFLRLWPADETLVKKNIY